MRKDFLGIYHVHPEGDLESHILKCDINVTNEIPIPICLCTCSPTFKEENGSLIVIHNSFDGREGVEQAREILNSTIPFS